jgi:glucose/arabinose dehydrogenase
MGRTRTTYLHGLILFILLLALAACRVETEVAGPVSSNSAAVVYTTTPIVTGLRGPTQMIDGPDGRLWVAQLNGGENAGTGQVVAVDMGSGAQEVLVDGLTKPTGLAVTAGALWIAAGADVLQLPLDDALRPGAPETVLADLPTNGRSNGTLTVTPDGRILFETSGRRQGNGALAGSGQLWALDPDDPTVPVSLATGLKGAYAHLTDSAGVLWTTEIGDDPVNGQAPPDEINRVEAGGGYGWPGCYGLREPALNYGGTADLCAATLPPIALLPPRSTPTGIVESPWEPGVLLVALWQQGEIVRIDPATATERVAAVPEVILSGLGQPQHLLLTADGLLVSDHASGTIQLLQRTAGE